MREDAEGTGLTNRALTDLKIAGHILKSELVDYGVIVYRITGLDLATRVIRKTIIKPEEGTGENSQFPDL